MPAILACKCPHLLPIASRAAVVDSSLPCFLSSDPERSLFNELNLGQQCGPFPMDGEFVLRFLFQDPPIPNRLLGTFTTHDLKSVHH